MPSDCIFCKIVKGEIPCYKVYEDADFLAFLDINPINKGHTLIVPKEHYETILDVPDNLLNRLITVVKKLDRVILKTTNTNSCNIDINQGKEAGQLVPHLHVHIIPRFSKDKFKEWPTKKLSEKDLKKIAEKIRNSL